MKSYNKIINIVCGVLFFWRAFASVIGLVNSLMNSMFYYIDPVSLVMTAYGIVVLSFMCVFALQQVRRGKVLNILGGIYIVFYFICS